MVELPAGKSKRAQKIVKPSPRLGLRVVNRRLWVAIAVGLGARRSEVEALDWVDIDLDAGVLANHGTKTKGNDRATPIPGELLAELSPSKLDLIRDRRGRQARHPWID